MALEGVGRGSSPRLHPVSQASLNCGMDFATGGLSLMMPGLLLPESAEPPHATVAF